MNDFFFYPKYLLPGEKVIFKTNRHWLDLAVPLFSITTVCASYITLMPLFFPEDISILRELTLAFIASCLFLMIVVFLNWYCIRYYLTNKRLIEERGIIGKKTMSIWLRRVQNVTSSFGVLGRIFGFGDIFIESAGTRGKIVFDFLPAPQKLKHEIEKAIHFL